MSEYDVEAYVTYEGNYIWVNTLFQGGSPCVRRTRMPIRVWVSIIERGGTLEEIHEGWPHYPKEQAALALEEYHRNKEEIKKAEGRAKKLLKKAYPKAFKD